MENRFILQEHPAGIRNNLFRKVMNKLDKNGEVKSGTLSELLKCTEQDVEDCFGYEIYPDEELSIEQSLKLVKFIMKNRKQ